MASDKSCHATSGSSGSLPEYFSEILSGKDKMIKVQAKRIEMLEYEVNRLRLVRETLSTQLALAICQLQQQGRLPPGRYLERSRLSDTSENVSFQVNGHSEKTIESSECLNSQTEVKVVSSSNGHFIGESTLTRRQEQLASKYGGSVRAYRAASKIQQTFRQYSLNRNFEKLRQEVENTRSNEGDRRLRLRKFNSNVDEDILEQTSTVVGDIVDKEFGDIYEDGDPDLLGGITFGSKDRLFITEEEESSRESSPSENSSTNVKGETKSIKDATDIKISQRLSNDGSRPSGVIDPSSVNFEKVLEGDDDDDNDSVIVSSTGSAEDQLRGLQKLQKQLRVDEHLGLEKFRLLSLRERFGSLHATPAPSTINGFAKSFQFVHPGTAPMSAQRQNSNDRIASSDHQIQDSVRRNLAEEYNSIYQQPAANVAGDASPVWRRKPNSSWLSSAGLEGNPLFNSSRSTHHFNGDGKDDYFGSSATSSTADSTSLGSGDAVNAAIAASSFDVECGSSGATTASGPHGLSDRQTKRLYRIGLNLFNRKPERGVQFLISYRFIENKPRSVARFLLTRKGLSKQMIGSYLGNLLEQFNMDVLDCFASEIDLSGLEIDSALRKFQSHFRMPGEAQKIQRLMESFASCYCDNNPNIVSQFQSPDIVLLLSYAIVMLNTDLHNGNIKPEKKMNCQEFVKNLKGLDCGRDIDPATLQGIYDRISSSPLKPANDHVVQVAKVDNMIVGKKPDLVQPHRRLVCYCRLFEVFDPLKREKSNQHQREVFLFNDILLVTKQSTKKKNSFVYNFRESFPLAGMTIVLFDLPHCKHGIQLLSGHDNLVLITFCAKNEVELKKFVEDLNEAILEVNEMETLRMQEELSKQSGSDPTLNYASVGSSHYSSTPSIQSRGSGDQIPPYLNSHHQSYSRNQTDVHELHTSSGLSLADSRQYLYNHLAGMHSSNFAPVYPQGNPILNRHSKDSGIVDIDTPLKHYNMPDELRTKPFLSPALDRQLHQKLLHQIQLPYPSYFNETIIDPAGNNRNSSGSLDSGMPSIVTGSSNSVPDRNPSYAGQSFLAPGHLQGIKASSLVCSVNHGITSSASSLVSSSSSSSSSSKFNLFARKNNKSCKTEDQ